MIRRDPDLIGHTLDGRYEVVELIGTGGVGMVYKARRVKLDRLVAVKVLHESLVQNADWVRRFQREAVAMSRLHHPHCVSVIDFGMFRSRPYLVMEYVPGKTVIRLLRRGPFSPQRAVGIGLQLLEALAYFHRHHVIHRDLKSENVILAEASETGDFVKVFDFGMAKILEGPGADSQISKLGSVPGTASTMAPEQITQVTPDARIDIYATGILLYEMIVGARPFQSTDTTTLVRMQMTQPPRPPREIRGEEALSLDLEQVILKSLEKERQRRYESAEEMAEALRLTPEGRALGPPPEATQPELPPEVLPPPRRRWLAPALAGGAVLLAGVVAVLLVWPGPAPEPPRPARAVANVARGQPPPPPVPVAQPWLAHRDLAVTYQGRGQREDAYREVMAALGDDASAARADPALADVAVGVLTAERINYVVEAFRANPRLAEALTKATATGATSEQRHAALQALKLLGQEARADLTAMRILDVEQATACPQMRAAFTKLRKSKPPDDRVAAFIKTLRARGPKDPHVRCLRREL